MAGNQESSAHRAGSLVAYCKIETAFIVTTENTQNNKLKITHH